MDWGEKNCKIRILLKEVRKRMKDPGSRMEVCPYCKKPFKRLKSHLPHCKMIGPDTAVGHVYHTKPAVPLRAKKEKRPTRDLSKGRAPETENEKRSAKLISNRPGWTVAPFPPPPAVGLERAGANKAAEDTKDPDGLSFPAGKHSEPKITSQGEMAAPSGTWVTTCLKTELVRDVCKSEESRCGHSEAGAALLVGSVEPSLSKEARKHSLVLPGDVQASCPNRTLDTVVPQRQRILAKLQDVSTSDYHSPENLSSGVQGVRGSVSRQEGSSRGGGHLPGASTDPGKEKHSEALIVGLHTKPLSEIQFKENPEKEFGLVVRRGSKENAKKSVSATGEQHWSSGDFDCKNLTGEKSQDSGLLNLFTTREAAYSKPLSVSQPGHQSVASLDNGAIVARGLTPVKSLQEKTQLCAPHQVSAVTLSGESKDRASIEARSACQPQALQMVCQPSSYSAQHLVSKIALVSRVVVADTKALSIPVGLEWFPELYPGYVGLGLLPRTPQHWNSTVHMPQLPSPRGEHISQVPGLEGSSAAGRSLEPPTRLTASTFPLMRLLGAVPKGWVRCSTALRRSGVGAITMLFTGYFVLGCSWSFRHLKLQRWRK